MARMSNGQPPYAPFRVPLSLGLLLAALLGLVLAGCGSSSSKSKPAPSPFPPGAKMLPSENLTQAAKEAFIQARSGDVIVFPEGRFMLEDTLVLEASEDMDGNPIERITLMGHGMDKTILDFSNSLGGDGILVQNGTNVTIKNLAVYEAPNNGIKLTNTNGVHLKSVAAVWEGPLTSANGAYGLYPVESSNIVIEDSYARGSADAGIYVGQSSHIVLRRNIAEENVAGIEVENSSMADVYENIARGNTGGILVFDLPIGNAIYGSGVRVFNNEVTGNNEDNFANVSANPAGVHITPPGTGIIVLGTSDVEIYQNTITDHDTLAITVTSFYIAEDQLSYANPTYANIIDDGWRPVPRNIAIYDNTITDTGADPRGAIIEDLITGFTALHGGMPAILYDGIGELLANAAADPQTTGAPFGDADRVCASANGSISYGSVYGTDPTDPANLGMGGLADPPPLLFEAPQSAILSCTVALARLPAASVMIDGKAYGCGSAETGDPSQASCNL